MLPACPIVCPIHMCHIMLLVCQLCYQYCLYITGCPIRTLSAFPIKCVFYMLPVFLICYLYFLYVTCTCICYHISLRHDI